MSLIEIVIVALGLAMDAFAVSVASGLEMKKVQNWQAFRIASFFGFFQAVMPIAGWMAGSAVSGYISSFDHWIAFGLLVLIGSRMIYESQDSNRKKQDHLCFSTLCLLSIATSIDALAVGIGLAFLNVHILFPAFVIGIITFVLSYAGIFLGKKIGRRYESRIEIAGGVILILIGFKILFDHLAI